MLVPTFPPSSISRPSDVSRQIAASSWSRVRYASPSANVRYSVARLRSLLPDALTVTMKGLEVGVGRPVVVKPLPLVEDTAKDVAGVLTSKLVVDDRLLE